MAKHEDIENDPMFGWLIKSSSDYFKSRMNFEQEMRNLGVERQWGDEAQPGDDEPELGR